MYKIIFILLFVSFIEANELDKFNISDFRLGENIEVKHYDLALRVYIEEEENSIEKNFTFTGTVKIDFKLTNQSSDIKFHIQNLTVEIKEFKKNGFTIKNTIVEVEDKVRTYYKITLNDKNNFTADEYMIEIDYKGVLNDDFFGFYKSYYIDDKQNKVWLASTHFEPTAARMAFPCFDEPQLKATFKLQIEHNKKYHAISNTNGTRKPAPSDTRVVTQFQETPPMSTYLLAFVISDFKNLTKNVTVNETTFTHNVWAKPNGINKANAALDYGVKVLKTLEEYTNVSFELTKMDQVAVGSLNAGAMENWGIVIYKEEYLLHDDKYSLALQKYNTLDVIAHEFAHQWFGNLVSPKWWTYLWLNEGFAEFFSSYITNLVEPKWRANERAVVLSLQQGAFTSDSNNWSDAMNQNVTFQHQISNFQTGIVYQKSAAVIRMMQHFLTPKVFQHALSAYLKKFTHKSADSNDLFEVIQETVDTVDKENESSGKKLLPDTVKNIMKSWVENRNYPTIHVTRNYENNKIELKQERFLIVPENKTDNTLWYIPINYVTESEPDFEKDTTPMKWMKDASMTLDVTVDANKWIMLNKQQSGYYRVNYDTKNWELIIKYLEGPNRNKIHPINRAQLLNDALAFSKQGKLSLKTFFNILSTFKNDTDVIAWYPGFVAIRWLEYKLTNSAYDTKFKKFVHDTSKALVTKVGIDSSEDTLELSMKSRILQLCFAGHEGCQQKMKNDFDEWIKSNKQIDSDWSNIVLCNGLKTANYQDWTKVFNMVLQAPSTVDVAIKSSLGCTRNKTTLQYYLNYTLHNSTLDLFRAVMDICSEAGPSELDVVLDFVMDYFIHILLKYKSNVETMKSLLNLIAGRITNMETYNKFVQKSKHIPEDIKKDGVHIAMENINWMKRNEADLQSWSSGASFRASFGLISVLLLILYITNKQ